MQPLADCNMSRVKAELWAFIRPSAIMAHEWHSVIVLYVGVVGQWKGVLHSNGLDTAVTLTMVYVVKRPGSGLSLIPAADSGCQL